MIFERSFDNLSQKDIELLNSYFDGYDYQSSSHTLVANYIWRNTHDLSWQVIGDYLCIAGLGTLETEEKEYFMSFPLTASGTYEPEKVRQTLKQAEEIFVKKGKRPEMGLIPGTLVPVLKEAFGDDVDAFAFPGTWCPLGDTENVIFEGSSAAANTTRKRTTSTIFCVIMSLSMKKPPRKWFLR